MIKKLNVGEPIDYNTINALIERLNALDSADRLSAIAYDLAKTKYVTTKDNLNVQAFRVSRNASGGGGYYSSIGRITFPNAFAAPPIVTVTFNGGNSYLVPYVSEITASAFLLSVARLSYSWADVPSAVSVNVIAVGPMTLK